jgi:adenylate cyclase
LGVKYVLEGSVRKAGDQVRIEVELVDASTGAEVSTERFDRPLKDNGIVGKVVTRLGLLLKLDELTLPHGLEATRPTENLKAFDDLLRAY